MRGLDSQTKELEAQRRVRHGVVRTAVRQVVTESPPPAASHALAPTDAGRRLHRRRGPYPRGAGRCGRSHAGQTQCLVHSLSVLLLCHACGLAAAASRLQRGAARRARRQSGTLWGRLPHLRKQCQAVQRRSQQSSCCGVRVGEGAPPPPPQRGCVGRPCGGQGSCPSHYSGRCCDRTAANPATQGYGVVAEVRGTEFASTSQPASLHAAQNTTPRAGPVPRLPRQQPRSASRTAKPRLRREATRIGDLPADC